MRIRKYKVNIGGIKFKTVKEPRKTMPIIVNGYLKYYRPKKGDVIVDVGSYQGVFALYVSQLVGDSGRVICFEPSPINFNYLLKNIKLNKIRNIYTSKVGLWNCKDRLWFQEHGKYSAIGSWGNHLINVDALENLVDDHIDFVKMDVEGAEIEALKGAKRFVDDGTKFAVASYHLINGKESSHYIHRLCDSWNIKCTTGFMEHRTTYINC